jgi:glycine/D-amino acid oxidase-like deaminating enzyme
MKYFSSSHNKSKYLRPPDLYEYFVDNFWMKAASIENQKINEPLRESHNADIVIIGGGYSGLSSAYNIRQKFPDKRIVLLEGAYCGYGASGRNGGFCVATALLGGMEEVDAQTQEELLEVSLYGIKQIKHLISKHGVDCDFEENGMLELAFDEKQAMHLEESVKKLRSYGLEAEIVEGKVLEEEIKSPRVISGLKLAHGAILNPAKLAREMKRVVEEMDVEVRERSVVTRITPGKVIHVDTELGAIRAPVIVLGLNAYSPKLGFFKNRVFPVNTFIIATEPLSEEQWDSIGWKNRQGVSDSRVNFNYSIPSVDGRIVMGGSDYVYYPNDALGSGNDKVVTELLKKDLILTFPQLEGLQVEHAWGGSTIASLNFTPSVGVMGEYKNIYYGVGYSEGVPSTQTGGRIIADLMAGESNAFTNHYVVNKNIRYAGTSFLRGAFFEIIKKARMRREKPAV